MEQECNSSRAACTGIWRLSGRQVNGRTDFTTFQGQSEAIKGGSDVTDGGGGGRQRRWIQKKQQKDQPILWRLGCENQQDESNWASVVERGSFVRLDQDFEAMSAIGVPYRRIVVV